ncbi:BTB/POZ domain-containing protein 6-like [Oculina patagonica]
MSVVEKNWQTTRPTIRERSKYMFNNDLFSDVKFVVLKADGECGSKQVVPAHKFVLSISSPVFEAMFYGELAETGDSIELPDCEYESLLELFRYMYSDEVQLSGSNVMGVLYLAKKYMLPSLADKCTEYLQHNLDPSNVFSILPFVQKYEEKTMVDRCWKVIDKVTEEAVKSEGFSTIERSLLEAVVVRDTLTIEEIELFKAVDLWATKECERQGLAADGAVKRRVLGEDVIEGIRFPTMKQEDFASVVLDSKILTPDEIVNIIKYFNSVSTSPVGFPETKRSINSGNNILRCCRVGSVSDQAWGYGDRKDAINFSVDKDIELCGVCFFGNQENKPFSVDLEVVDVQGKKVLMSNSGRFFSSLVQARKCSYYGFEFLLEKKIILNKNTTYGIRVLISGSPSLRGVNCVRSVQCSDVTFTFLDSVHACDGTDLKQGQFPELLFCLKQ